jgi:hypothetical protein
MCSDTYYNPSLPQKIIKLYLARVDVFTTCFSPTGPLSSAKTIQRRSSGKN